MAPFGYLETDTAEDAVSSLELAHEFYERAQSDQRYWKWFIIAFHSGVQGIFALALDGGSSLLVQKPGVASAMETAFKKRAVPPRPHMDNFLKLYKKLQRRESFRTSEALPLPESRSQEEAVIDLDKLRDDFIHFNTKSWLIQHDRIRKKISECIGVVSFLVTESHSIFWREEALLLRATEAIDLLNQRISVNS